MHTSLTLEKMSFANLCGGAAAEQFDRELSTVLDNIADPNAKAKVAREITIKVTIVPTDDRSRAVVACKTTSKLAPADALEAHVDLVQEGRKQVAYQRGTAPQQPAANVTNIAQAASGGQ